MLVYGVKFIKKADGIQVNVVIFTMRWIKREPWKK
jgi:hypothetical protein